VEELFELARLDARQVSVKAEQVQIAELAQDVALKLLPRAQEAGVTVSVRPRADLPFVSCDLGLIERVLTNLVENAVRHTPPGGVILLDIEPEERGVRITVADTGEGIAAEDLPRIFERFYRADRSRDRSAGGAGLGLAIARQIVDLHGGTLGVESAPGQGARFSFVLPAA
jgi:signal transduction histidine kinase